MVTNTKHRVSCSCSCRECRRASSAVKAFHKRMANKALRRSAKAAILNGGEDTCRVSTGYRD